MSFGNLAACFNILCTNDYSLEWCFFSLVSLVLLLTGSGMINVIKLGPSTCVIKYAHLNRCDIN